MEKRVYKNAKRFLFGGIVGLANGVFGGGGGMIAVPLLQKTGIEKKKAHATAILIILPVSFVSLLLYAWKGLYDFSVWIPTALGVTMGGFLGAKLLDKISGKKVSLLFSFLQALAGCVLLFSK